MPSNSSNLTRNGNKKRVRRIQRELPLFRRQVQDLELQLKRIKLQQTPSSASQSSRQLQDRSHFLSVWNAIADRQFKERLKAERRQKEILDVHTEAVQWSGELRKLLEKCADNGKKVTQIEKCKAHHQFWDLSGRDEDEVYSEQLASVARLRLVQLQMQHLTPDTTKYLRCELSMGRDVPKLEPNSAAGIVFETRCGVMIPFNLDVAVDAYWRLCRFDHLDWHLSYQKLDTSMDTIMRSFSTRMNFEDFVSDGHGKYTCQKYSNEDSVSIVWSGMWNILEFGGTKFRGMQLHKRGSITLRRVPRQGSEQQSMATIVETRFETTPVFHESVVDAKEQTEALINSLTQAYPTLNDVFCTMMSGLLVEEDWKATFGTHLLRDQSI